eukprot:Sspe_Gene.101864::Locus_76528_Transcript_1_1_Confidence_1.000_Length_793::g.101864::m.101864
MPPKGGVALLSRVADAVGDGCTFQRGLGQLSSDLREAVGAASHHTHGMARHVHRPHQLPTFAMLFGEARHSDTYHKRRPLSTSGAAFEIPHLWVSDTKRRQLQWTLRRTKPPAKPSVPFDVLLEALKARVPILPSPTTAISLPNLSGLHEAPPPAAAKTGAVEGVTDTQTPAACAPARVPPEDVSEGVSQEVSQPDVSPTTLCLMIHAFGEAQVVPPPLFAAVEDRLVNEQHLTTPQITTALWAITQ